MKVDLDQLERKARRWDRAIGTDDEADARVEHIVANSPPVTLALIARIRELEGTVRSFARAEFFGQQAADALWAVVEKGVVLP